uniref:Uncharacterized protein n=1 Tax=Conchiformibius kuhniae TaxID=211502 RepID=A0A8T9MQW1_9NEIS|nr:hypothetical protein LVJ77_07925 [Conchiformibius kuhniae]
MCCTRTAAQNAVRVPLIGHCCPSNLACTACRTRNRMTAETSVPPSGMAARLYAPVRQCGVHMPVKSKHWICLHFCPTFGGLARQAAPPCPDDGAFRFPPPRWLGIINTIKIIIN